jgi:hypothetical protein
MLLQREELASIVPALERRSLPAAAVVRRLWASPTLRDEASEQQAFFRIERSHRRLQTHGLLLQLGVLRVLESFVVGDERGSVNKTLAKTGMALLVGGIEQKENKTLEVDDAVIRNLCECIDATSLNEDWHGHRYNVETMLLGARLLAVNDKNKRRFVQNSVIPFMLSLIKEPNVAQSVAQLSTAVLLDLSYGMRVRQLLHPVLLVWHQFVKLELKEKERFSLAPPSNHTVDFAAPTHVVNVKAIDYEIAFTFELHEAASEGVWLWMRRLVEDENADPCISDSHGATAMHYAAMNGHIEAMDYLLTVGVDINAEDQSGCTPKAWLLMARFVEYGPYPQG